MHRALQIPELVLRVVDQVDTDAKRTLVSFALACRSFESAGLDAVWRDPGANTPRYILACFPSDALSVFSTLDALSVELQRPVTLVDWRRPMLNCSRVRVLDVRPAAYGTMDYNTEPLSFLLGTIPGDCLFPRLEHLRWNAHEQIQSGNLLRALLSPYLRTLQLRLTTFNLTMLPRIAQRCASLTQVEVGEGLRDDTVSHEERDAISTFVLALNRVERLMVPSLDGQALAHLALLPDLAVLQLHSFSHDISLDASVDPGLAFLSLTALTISAAHMPATLDLLRHIVCSPLTELSFRPMPSSTSQQIGAFYSALSTTAAHKSVFRILHFSGENYEWDPNLWRVPRSALLALATFSNLSHLTMHSPLGFELDEGVISALTRGCPLLRKVVLEQDSAESSFDLSLLAYFAKYCQRLKQIQATFNTTHVPDSATSIQNTLELLDVGSSYLDANNAVDVADFLTTTFPMLRVFRYFEDDWEMVEELLQERLSNLNDGEYGDEDEE